MRLKFFWVEKKFKRIVLYKGCFFLNLVLKCEEKKVKRSFDFENNICFFFFDCGGFFVCFFFITFFLFFFIVMYVCIVFFFRFRMLYISYKSFYFKRKKVILVFVFRSTFYFVWFYRDNGYSFVLIYRFDFISVDNVDENISMFYYAYYRDSDRE